MDTEKRTVGLRNLEERIFVLLLAVSTKAQHASSFIVSTNCSACRSRIWRLRHLLDVQ